MQGKYNFIKFQKVIFRDFSLYSKNGKNCVVTETINNGVYCLAGANGLGKTSFLNAINYCLTGIVLNPDREVLAPNEIITENKKYTEKYFQGRVKEKDKKSAEIELLFKVGNKFFRIVRGFFEREELRLLEVYSHNNGKKIPDNINSDQSPKELNLTYQNLVVKEIGLDYFDLFIFYQLYVLTFDENRKMLFWDDNASYHTLTTAFNTKLEDAEKVIQLKRTMDKHESDGRNSRWDATQTKKKIDDLLQKTNKPKDSNIAELEKQYYRLHKNAEIFQRSYGNVKTEFDTLLKVQSHLNSEIMQLRMEQGKLFSNYSRPRSKLLENTNIKMSIKKQACCLCNSLGNHVVENIERNIYKDKCPLCNTTINESNDEEQANLLELIKSNDAKLSEKTVELENLLLEANGKKIELEKAEFELEQIKEEISDFEKENSEISLKSSSKNDINLIIEQLRKQFEILNKDSIDSYKKRDKLKPEYDKLLSKIETAYKEAEIDFVPIFKKLAKSFIGLDLNINLEKNNRTLKLVLELQNTARTESYQLSESQRFFLDIALRMSLAIYLSKRGSEATMLIDTPEGSLDIAYESRVGDMFANFVKDYNQNLIMTANINASQLLVTLAERCRKNKMKFRRMLGWTTLTPIQKEGEYLFEKVYSNIENTLNKENL
jgi:DNA repair exonuclease SbcCD ATPase subunit